MEKVLKKVLQCIIQGLKIPAYTLYFLISSLHFWHYREMSLKFVSLIWENMLAARGVPWIKKECTNLALTGNKDDVEKTNVCSSMYSMLLHIVLGLGKLKLEGIFLKYVCKQYHVNCG